jgi:hypothetical protein
MALTGHSAAHLPWPMHLDALTSVATPSTIPRIFPSGQAARQEPLPMQTSGSMTGCSDAGTFSSRRMASASFRFARRSSRHRRNR